MITSFVSIKVPSKSNITVFTIFSPKNNFENNDEFSPFIKFLSSIKTINITGDIISIPDYAFSDLVNVRRININVSTIKSIGKYAFANCVNLTTFDLPESVESIGEGIFFNCTSLNNVNMKLSNIRKIEKYSFAYCKQLMNIEIPDTVYDIDDFSFFMLPV